MVMLLTFKLRLFHKPGSCHTEHRNCTLSKILMPASKKSQFITAGFAFFSFPLSKIYCLLGFLQRDLHFLVSRCQKSSVCLVFHSGIFIFSFSAVANIFRFAFLSFPLFAEFCQKGKPQQSAIFEAGIPLQTSILHP